MTGYDKGVEMILKASEKKKKKVSYRSERARRELSRGIGVGGTHKPAGEIYRSQYSQLPYNMANVSMDVDPDTGLRTGRGVARVPRDFESRAKMVGGYGAANAIRGLFDTVQSFAGQRIGNWERKLHLSPVQRANLAILEQKKHKIPKEALEQAYYREGLVPPKQSSFAREAALNMAGYGVAGMQGATGKIVQQYPWGLFLGQIRPDPARARAAIEHYATPKGHLFNRWFDLQREKRKLEAFSIGRGHLYPEQQQRLYDIATQINNIEEQGAQKFKNPNWAHTMIQGHIAASRRVYPSQERAQRELRTRLEAQGVSHSAIISEGMMRENLKRKGLLGAYDDARLARELEAGRGKATYQKKKKAIDTIRIGAFRLAKHFTKDAIKKEISVTPVQGCSLVREDLQTAFVPRSRRRRIFYGGKKVGR